MTTELTGDAAVEARLDGILGPIKAELTASEPALRAALGDAFTAWLWRDGIWHDYLDGALAPHGWLPRFCPPAVLAAAVAHMADKEAGS